MRVAHIDNRPVALRAARGELSMVVVLTVGVVVPLEEPAHPQLHVTPHTHEVLRVPGLP